MSEAPNVEPASAVAFTQYFGSALQPTPHLHVLVPEGLWAGDVFVRLPPPTPEEVAGILRRLVKQLAVAALLVKRLVALVPPRGKHLTTFHGVFAPSAGQRPDRAAGHPDASASSVPSANAPWLPEASPTPAPAAPTRPRLDWATLQQRTFGVDVWTYPCGGKRKVLAIVTSRRTAEQMLQNMGLASPRPPRPAAHGPPQLALPL